MRIPRRVGPSEAWILMVLSGSSVSAQAVESAELTAGVGLGIYEASGPYGAPGALGLFFGYERRVHAHLILRGAASGLWTTGIGDALAICYPDDAGGCVRPPVFPSVLVSGEATTLLQPIRSVPVWGVGAIGVALPRGQVTHRADDAGFRVGPRATWRAGIELGVGVGARAPRVQLAYSWYSGRLLSADGVITFSLAIPLTVSGSAVR